MKRTILVVALVATLALSGCSDSDSDSGSGSGSNGASTNGSGASASGQSSGGAPAGGYSNPMTAAEIKAAAQGTALSCPDDPAPPTGAQLPPDPTMIVATEVLVCAASGVAVTFYTYPDVVRASGARDDLVAYWCDNVSNTPPAAIGSFVWSAYVDDASDPAGAAALQTTVDALGPIATLENPTCP